MNTNNTKIKSFFKFHSIEFNRDMKSRVIDNLLSFQFYAPTLDKMNDIREGIVSKVLLNEIKNRINSGESINFKFLEEMMIEDLHWAFMTENELEKENAYLNNFIEQCSLSDEDDSDDIILPDLQSLTDEDWKEVKEKSMTQLLDFLDEKLFIKKTGVYCVATDNQSISQWERYTGYYGICLEYDAEKFSGHLDEKYKSHHKGPIQYIDYNQIKQKILNKIHTLNSTQLILLTFFLKTRDWESENEYRFVFSDEGAYEFNPLSLKTIYFGHKMHPIYRAFIIEHIQNKNEFQHVNFKVFKFNEFGEVQFDEIK